MKTSTALFEALARLRAASQPVILYIMIGQDCLLCRLYDCVAAALAQRAAAVCIIQ